MSEQHNLAFGDVCETSSFRLLRGSRTGRVDTLAVAPFFSASRFFTDAVSAVSPTRYEDAWSDEWSVLDLIAHGNRANVLAVEYYERPVRVAGPEYARPENIAARARQAVRDLGDDPVAAVREAAARAEAVVAAAPADAVVGTPFGVQTLDRYLQSRTAELVLHGLDLDTNIEPPIDAVSGCAAFLVMRATNGGRGVDVVRALSGRGSLPPGFNVY